MNDSKCTTQFNYLWVFVIWVLMFKDCSNTNRITAIEKHLPTQAEQAK